MDEVCRMDAGVASPLALHRLQQRLACGALLGVGVIVEVEDLVFQNICKCNMKESTAKHCMP